jgi:hypothetical protein
MYVAQLRHSVSSLFFNIPVCLPEISHTIHGPRLAKSYTCYANIYVRSLGVTYSHYTVIINNNTI